jgi:murein DD-endopeptidase MepM/ murein hydrolase activator NlpD
LLHTCALSTFGFLGFCGWHLQARYGLQGHHVVYLGLDAKPERWSIFEGGPPSEALAKQAEQRRAAAQERADRLGLGNRQAASLLLTGMVAPAWAEEASVGGDLGDGTLRWPVERGWFGRGYGSGEGGYHLAVDINGALGAEVSAAAPGIVGYVGSELRGYGHVVLVVHPGGWVTLYGHNRRILVRAGERVRQGQQLAELGSTGRSEGPHVHFELIYQGRNCDPIPFVPASSIEHRSAAGPSEQVSWDPQQPKPASIRCKRRMQHPLHEDHDSEDLWGAAEHTSEGTQG